jgi:diguanylate cyclase (GGDEF)-like protein/PAS domain S-box-containing protein
VEEADAAQLLDAAAVGMSVWEATREDGGALVLRWANEQAGRQWGRDVAGLVGRTVDEIFPKAACDAVWSGLLLRAALGQQPVELMAPYGDQWVRRGWFSVQVQPLGEGRVLVFDEDVTDAERRARALAASERLSAQIVERLHEGIVVVDLCGRVTRANEAAARLCGMALGELVGSRIRDLAVQIMRADGAPMTVDDTPGARVLRGETIRNALVQIVRRDGTAVWAEVDCSPLSEPDGTRYGGLCTYRDVSDRVRRERRMRREADTDPLTGLANRRALERALEPTLVRARAGGREVAVLMVDLDGFKALNDRWGHLAGDAALREVARRLGRCVRERDLVARVGGDEFVLLLADLQPGEDAAEACADRVEVALREPVDLQGAIASIGAATGVACFPRDGADGAALLAHADRAMYAAKR